MTISVATPVTHSMVCRKDVGGLSIVVELVNQLRDFLHTLVDNFDIIQVLLGIRPETMACCIQAK